ncbi:signal peptidase I [Pseudalkalibacillus hwajinpoensis]|uniref:signal peptidase I n=1 Tax=Guptibacillus hwajinpoensis TaxID=208199 RepID=UPI001CD76C79|nr:signal peptidase I [Pseudalkalibacillus hwajinpoensis]MCA0990209.1 signal peptidase I [Pseudalkalibacillus hwajinpoensis]
MNSTRSAEKKDSWEWIRALIIAFILAGAVRYFIFAPIVVDGESMMPTLQDRDRMIVNKISYNIGDAERFDIIVFEAPEGKDYIKRVIGLPGDKVEYKGDMLYVNGKAMNEPYLESYKEDLLEGNLTYDFDLTGVTGEATVPEGHLFVMGDNRQHSKDSRSIGFVPVEKVIGEANVIFWPLNDIQVME